MKANWIWVDNNQQKDTYGEFYSEFNYDGGRLSIDLSVDSNYELYINGQFVNSSQYCDFPHYKVYETLDIAKYCVKGKNKLAIIVWYYGENFFTYSAGNAALWYVISGSEGMVDCSNENTLSRYSVAYKNGYEKKVNTMMGYSYLYDSTKEDNWKNGELNGFTESVIVDQDLKLYPRKTKKLDIQEPVKAEIVKKEENYTIYDMGREDVGYLTFKVKSKKKQTLTFVWGEHIMTGRVHRILGSRDFSFEIVVGEGVTEYTNYMRRLGLRYLEVIAEDEVEIEYATIKPCPYPLSFVDRKFDDPIHQKIYDVATRTLELCIHEHYEDCPWREQSLYAMDSRNQMLCGYYAFEEYDLPRDNLLLFSKDRREDKILTICTPSKYDLCIPSFSLHYIIAVYEYTVHSGDLSLVREIMPKLQDIVSAFTDRIENGLVMNFEAKTHWNFYEWADGMEGDLGKDTQKKAEAALNCFFSLALQKLQALCDMVGVEANYTELADKINKAVRETFFDEESGVYLNNLDVRGKSELVNALAVMCGASKGEEAAKLCEILSNENDLTRISLSMACFKYDALLAHDEKKYIDYVINDLVYEYKMMLDLGATSFWEYDVKRHSVINNSDAAGSFCHAWSAMPVYYFTKYLQ
ncbi:MAG: family 78 glycoside hydrolase catalytic domain [Clostridia bacterium]|nr:family 78 glycoside hydrolase catalytic domain [Clostridia bacterium]